MTAQLADVTFERIGSIAVADLSGEIDMSNAASIRQRIAEYVSPDDDALVLDLSDLSFIDSAGLHVIFELGGTLDERRQRLHACVPDDGQVSRSVGIIGLPRTISVHRRRKDAIEAARGQIGDVRPFSPDD